MKSKTFYFVAPKPISLRGYTQINRLSDIGQIPDQAELGIVDRIPLHLDVPYFWDYVRVHNITLRKVWNKEI